MNLLFLVDNPNSPEDETQPSVNRIYYVGTFTYPVKFTPEDTVHYDEMYTYVEFTLVETSKGYQAINVRAVKEPVVVS